MMYNNDPSLFLRMMNQISDPVILLSADFTFLWANNAYSQHMKIDVDKIISQKLDVVVPPDYLPVLKDKYKNLTAENPAFENIYPSALPDGSIIIEKWHNEAVFNNSGILQYYYCIANLKEKEEENAEGAMNKTDLVKSTLLRSTLIGIIVTIEGKLSYINQKTWEIFGLKVGDIPEEIKLSEFFRKILPEYDGKLLKQTDSREAVSDEARFTHPNGQDRWISIIRKPQTLNKTSTDLILIEDITYKKLNEIETEAAKDRLSEVMRIAKLGYWEKDFVNNCWSWSNEIYNIFELPYGTIATEELVRSYMNEETVEERSGRISSTVNDTQKSSSHKFEYRIRLKKNKYKWIEGEAFYIKKSGINNDHFYGWSQDVTERKKIEEVLRDAKEKAEESERLKTAFLANMSHEIRTPLNAILGFSDLLTRKATVEEQNKFKQIIKQSSTLLLNIIDDILDISTIESGNLELHIEHIAVKEMFDSINTIFSEQASDDIFLIVEDPAENLSVQADIERLKQVLINLISNAFKYTSHGCITVCCTKNVKEKRAVFTIKDTGQGIDSTQLERIFNRFYQTDSFSKGTGLGLSITRSILDQMDGSISVKSVLGEGSEFSFSLPLI